MKLLLVLFSVIGLSTALFNKDLLEMVQEKSFLENCFGHEVLFADYKWVKAASDKCRQAQPLFTEEDLFDDFVSSEVLLFIIFKSQLVEITSITNYHCMQGRTTVM